MRISTIPIAFLAALAACETQTTLSPLVPSERIAASATPASDLPIYGLGGARRATPQSPCRADPFRQFDFWVGDWKVFSLAGAFVATSHIVTKLDGCIVEENWTPLNGIRGRSLNSYDAESGVWRQTWVPENTSQSRPLRLMGGLQPNGVMQMQGERHWSANPIVTYVDTIRWTLTDPTHLIQATSLDIPIANIHIKGAPHYERATSPLPPTVSPGSRNCQPGGDAAETRNFDFAVGSWRLTTANGQLVGSSAITIDPTLSGCLIEESFSTPKGYQAIGWLYYDAIENAYFRTYIDSEGERVELRGAFSDGVFVFTGAEPIRGADGAQVRMTWSQTSATTLRQLWETSRDGGATWRQAQDITFTRQ